MTGSKLTGKKLARFHTAIHRAKFDGANYLKIDMPADGSIMVHWGRGCWRREIYIGPRGGIREGDRDWWKRENSGVHNAR